MRKSHFSIKLGMVTMLALFLTWGIAPGAGAVEFQLPKITLELASVEHYWGFWYYAPSVEPSAGKAGHAGAPLDVAFTFNIENPNDFAVQLEDFKFTVAFEDFDMNTISTMATQWIPPGKTNQIKLHSIIDVRQSTLNLAVTSGLKLKEKNTSVMAQLQKWWTGIASFSFPVSVKGGAAIFSNDAGDSVVVGFEAQYP